MFHQKKSAEELRPDKAERLMVDSEVTREKNEDGTGKRAQGDTLGSVAPDPRLTD